MSWQTRIGHIPIVRFSIRRPIGFALLIGLALILAACGATGGGPSPTSTPRPSATATPVPCASWRVVSSPNGATYPMSILNSVTAAAPTSAWAVGVTYAVGDTIGPVDSLIERWDGSAWHFVASPGHDALNSVAAISPSNVWAVGGQLNYGVGTGILILHWDGKTWSIVPSAQPAGADFVKLTGVAAVTANNVWAVGSQDTSSAHLQQPLVERWDGASWNIVSSPLPQDATNGVLNAVTHIPGTNQLWAVGEWSKYYIPVLPQPLIERWDGSAWQISASPTLPSGALGGNWNSVVAISANNAWAVGDYYIKNPVDLHPLIGHWNGKNWTIVASPDKYGELDSVAAATAQDVRAAGSLLTDNTGNSQRLPLIEQWNGSAWRIMTSPQPSGALSGSLGIATDGVGNYWVVGSYLTAANRYQTLTLHCP